MRIGTLSPNSGQTVRNADLVSQSGLSQQYGLAVGPRYAIIKDAGEC